MKAIDQRLARLEAGVTNPNQITVITRALSEGPHQGEIFRVAALPSGRSWRRGDKESASQFQSRVTADGGPDYTNEAA